MNPKPSTTPIPPHHTPTRRRPFRFAKAHLKTTWHFQKFSQVQCSSNPAVHMQGNCAQSQVCYGGHAMLPTQHGCIELFIDLFELSISIVSIYWKKNGPRQTGITVAELPTVGEGVPYKALEPKLWFRNAPIYSLITYHSWATTGKEPRQICLKLKAKHDGIPMWRLPLKSACTHITSVALPVSIALKLAAASGLFCETVPHRNRRGFSLNLQTSASENPGLALTLQRKLSGFSRTRWYGRL